MAKNPIKTKQYKQIMTHLKDANLRETTKDKYKKIFTFLYYTGARINEVTTIKGQTIQEIVSTGIGRFLSLKRHKKFKITRSTPRARAEIKELITSGLITIEKNTIKTENTKARDILSQLILDEQISFKDDVFRTIPFSQNAINDFKDVFKDNLAQPNGYCVRSWNNKNKRVNVISLTTQLNNFLADIFGKGIYTTHSFRSGLFTEMAIDNKTDMKIVQVFADHMNPATTMRYLKPTMANIQQNLAR